MKNQIYKTLSRHILLSSVFLLALVAAAGCIRPCDFSIAVIADPHCGGGQDQWDRIDLAIKWINDNKTDRKIDMVVIVGDIAWGGDNLAKIKSKFDGLSIPYMPVMGDNELHAGDEITFDSVFSNNFDELALMYGESWNKAPVPVIEPQTGKSLFLQNYSFDHKGLHIMCTDWCTRKLDGLLEGEQAELFDFDGGTWSWFKNDFESSVGDIKNNILVFSHHPLHVSPAYPLSRIDLGAFCYDDFKTITDFTLPFQDYIFASYGGHYHVPFYQTVREGGYNVYAVRSLHQMSQLKDTSLFEEPTIKLINVTKNGDTFDFQNLLVYLNQKGKALIFEDELSK
jgi:hypothetical protein